MENKKWFILLLHLSLAYCCGNIGNCCNHQCCNTCVTSSCPKCCTNNCSNPVPSTTTDRTISIPPPKIIEGRDSDIKIINSMDKTKSSTVNNNFSLSNIVTNRNIVNFTLNFNSMNTNTITVQNNGSNNEQKNCPNCANATVKVPFLIPIPILTPCHNNSCPPTPSTHTPTTNTPTTNTPITYITTTIPPITSIRPSRKCCIIIVPCVHNDCYPYQYTCNQQCQHRIQYVPRNPCNNGCYRRTHWDRDWCQQDQCQTRRVDCSSCYDDFYINYSTYSECRGCFYSNY